MEIDYFAEEKASVDRYMTHYDELHCVFGRDKIDPIISDIVERINSNPDAFTWGESCQGHVSNYFFKGVRRPHLSPGYFGLALRDHNERTLRMTGDLEKLCRQNPIVTCSVRKEEIFRQGKQVYSHPLILVKIGEDRDSKDLSELRESYKTYLDAWNSISKIIFLYL